ncbi:hypothetical protein [Bacillus vallismortis]|uniref:hypothetical protein n=1 Tax=Bacillus vallismortis TaxID=72361 RepID=UPI003DB0F178
MNKKLVKSVRAASVEEVCERIREAHNLGFMVLVNQTNVAGAYNPNLYIVDLFMPVKEGAE